MSVQIRPRRVAKRLYVVFTMDLEPLAETSAGDPGPPDWDFSEQSARAYVNFLRSRGFRPVLLAHPEACAGNRAFLLEFLAAGDGEVGCHLHSQKFSEFLREPGESKKWNSELGGLSRKTQKEALELAFWHFEENLGFRPEVFRSGCFSANDDTFPVLHELGIKTVLGSCPGLDRASRSAVWTNAPLYPHFTSANSTMERGSLDLINVPHAVDTTVLVEETGCTYHLDLRAEMDSLEHDSNFENIAGNIMDRILRDDPYVWVLDVLAHNIYAYHDPQLPYFERLKSLTNAIVAAADERGITIVSARVSEIGEKRREINFA